MKTHLTLLLLMMSFLSVTAQKLSFRTLLHDKISIRAIEVSDDKVYYAGTVSKFGYVSLKNSSENRQVKFSESNLQFRTLAQDKFYFYTISIESPARFFRISKADLSFKEVYKDTAKNAFYDALIFHNGMFYTFSDPNENLLLKFGEFNMMDNKFLIKYYPNVQLGEGEAAFAASNTNIAAFKNTLWIATGGKQSQIIRRKNQKWEVFNAPFVQGTSSQGIYSIDFYKDKFGVAVGGDYTKQNDNINNIAISTDGGETWQIQASGKNSGYKTCVKIRPGSKGKEIIAVGDQNIEFSSDFGKSWTKISDEKNLYVCKWIDRNTLVFAGNNRILQASFED